MEMVDGMLNKVLETETQRWDGIILLSQMDARIKTFMLVENL
jgi:hypothetical protein